MYGSSSKIEFGADVFSDVEEGGEVVECPALGEDVLLVYCQLFARLQVAGW